MDRTGSPNGFTTTFRLFSSQMKRDKMASSRKSSIEVSTDAAAITQISANDVLLGRGAGPNEHKGNIAFRATVSKFKKNYMLTTNRKIKNSIAHKAIRAIKAGNGRFLQRAKGSDDIYELADDAIVLEKTKQALRHVDRTRRGKARTTYQPLLSSAQSHVSSFHVDSFCLSELHRESNRNATSQHQTKAIVEQLASRLQESIQCTLPTPTMLLDVGSRSSCSLLKAGTLHDFRESSVVPHHCDSAMDTLSSLLALRRSLDFQSAPEEELMKLLTRTIVLSSQMGTSRGIFPCAEQGALRLNSSAIFGFSTTHH